MTMISSGLDSVDRIELRSSDIHTIRCRSELECTAISLSLLPDIERVSY